MRTWILAMLIALLAGCITGVEEDDGDLEVEAQRAARPAMFTRVVLARLYQHSTFTLPGQTPRGAGEQLAKLRPTYVSGLWRLAKSDPLPDDVIRGYDEARRAVRTGTKNAVWFDVVLNANDYDTEAEVVGRMSKIRDAFLTRKLDVPEVWFFDFYSQGKPAVMEAAIRWAHKKGLLVGGNFWGGSYIPAKSDFLALDDHDELDKMFEQAKNLRARHPEVPLLVHIENNPQNPETGTGPNPRNYGFLWMLSFHPKCVANPADEVNGQPCTDGWSEARRREHLVKTASQKKLGYSVMYPVYFPLIPTGKDTMLAYDAPTDGRMFEFIRTQLGQ
jgi:hypothetical protein